MKLIKKIIEKSIIFLLTLTLLRFILTLLKEIAMDSRSNWISKLDEEEIVFLKRFTLASGSLKEVARIYDVTYPTVRLRLDRLIEKIKLNDSVIEDDYINLIKKLSVDNEISFEATKLLISEFRKLKKED